MSGNELTNQIINFLSEGKSLKEISDIIFKTHSTIKINKIISELGIELSKYSEKYLYMNKEWLKGQLQLYNISEICRKFNMPRTSVTRYAKKYKLYESQYRRKNKNYINEDYFKNIDSSNKAYWLGFIMADGCICLNKHTLKYYFSLRLSRKDDSHLIKFSKEINFDSSKIKRGISFRNNNKNYYSELHSYNNNFCLNLIDKGIIPHKTGKEIFPNISCLPEQYQSDFIRGFYDGDGYIKAETNTIKICSASKQIIESLRQWFINHDIQIRSIYTSKLKNNNNFYTFSISKLGIANFIDSIYYNNCLTFLDRKMKEINILRNQSL